MRLSHKFVKAVPDTLQAGIIYISVEYATAIHLCCCGCGYEVVTPFSPRDWKMSFDGETISLSPSIGNWSFKCQSHYWITNNRVEWAHKEDNESADAKEASCDSERPTKKKGRRKFWDKLLHKL